MTATAPSHGRPQEQPTRQLPPGAEGRLAARVVGLRTQLSKNRSTDLEQLGVGSAIIALPNVLLTVEEPFVQLVDRLAPCTAFEMLLELRP